MTTGQVVAASASLVIPAVGIVLGQFVDSLAGNAGWAGAGLLGLVLCWLLLKHLPDKDRQFMELVKAFKEEAREQRAAAAEALDKTITEFKIEASADRHKENLELRQQKACLEGTLKAMQEANEDRKRGRQRP